MTLPSTLAAPQRLAPRLVVSFLAALALLLGTAAFAPAHAAQLSSFTVSGTVTGEGGATVAAATVTLEPIGGDAGSAYLDTDEEGHYTFDNVAAGTYLLRVSSPWGSDFLPKDSASFKVSGDTAAPSVVLPLGGSISGVVQDSGTGAPVDTATVVARSTTDENAEPHVVGIEDGQFTVHGLLPDSYTLEIADWGGTHVAEFYDDVARVADATAVAVTKGHDTVLDHTIALDDGTTLTGTLVDDDAAPIADAYVTAIPFTSGQTEPDWEGSIAASTGEDGTYRLVGLGAGSYKIQYTTNNAFFEQYYNGKPTFATGDVVTVTDAGTQALGTTVMERTASLSGFITNSAGTPLPDRLVELFRVDGTSVSGESDAWAYTEEDGSFEVSSVHAGTYRVKYTDGLHVYQNKYGPDVTIASGEAATAGTIVLAKKPVVKKAATVKVTGVGGKKKVTLTITVKASGVTPTGKVTVKLGSRTLKTVTLRSGKVVTTITGQTKGKHAYTVVYAGDSKVLTKTVTSSKITVTS